MNPCAILCVNSWLPLLSLVLMLFAGRVDHRNDSPSGLMIKFIREPKSVPVLDLKPEFSWIVPSYARFKTGYRIMVASTKEKLGKDIADIWDSKKVVSNRSTEIEYGSENLSANSTYFWRINRIVLKQVAGI